jgi:hypothetical protein
MKLPTGVQTTVADLILQKTGYGKDSAKRIDRALRFDPENPAAWTRRCHGTLDGTTSDPATAECDLSPTHSVELMLSMLCWGSLNFSI